MSTKPITATLIVQFRDGSRITTAPPCFERMPCGCIADGKGTILDPIRVKHCAMHAQAEGWKREFLKERDPLFRPR